VSGDVRSPEQLRREQEAALLATVERGRGRGLVIDSMGVARRSLGGRRHVPEEDSGVCLGGRRDGEDGPAETTTWRKSRTKATYGRADVNVVLSFLLSQQDADVVSFLLSQRDAVCFLPSIVAGCCLSLYRLRQAASHGEGEGATPKKKVAPKDCLTFILFSCNPTTSSSVQLHQVFIFLSALALYKINHKF
jgi:hypothetical protein